MKKIGDKQLLQALELYLEDNAYDYAVMIDGPWGCGKSFFIREKFLSMLETKEQKYIYISLYGSNSINEISKQIYLQNMLGNEKTEVKSQFIGFASSVGFDILDKKGINIKHFGNFVKVLKKNICINKETVLIFDDLERAKVNVAEILGFINGFVEHQHLKTIIICNEKELDESLDNLEFKYLIASKDTISFSKPLPDYDLFKPYDRHSITKNKETDELKKLISIEELRNRVKELFDERTNYKKIKEKLIGNTFYYSGNLKEACLSIINTIKKNHEIYETDEYIEFFKIIEENISSLSDEMERLKHYNLRTFEFFLSKMLQFYKSIIRRNKSYIKPLFKDNLLFALKESVRYKCGENELERINCVESVISDYIRGKTSLENNFMCVLLHNYNILTSEEILEENIKIIYNWIMNNSKIINEALSYLKKHVEEIDSVIYARLLTSLALIESNNIVDSSDTDEFIDLINEELYKNQEAKKILYELKYMTLELQNEKEIYTRYLNKLRFPKEQKIHNPIGKWLMDENYHLSEFDEINVSDIAYLDNENIDKIYETVIKLDKALPIWNLYDIFKILFLKNFPVWEHSNYIDNNIDLINKLSKKLKNYMKKEQNIDKVIKYAIKKLNMLFNHINDKYKK